LDTDEQDEDELFIRDFKFYSFDNSKRKSKELPERKLLFDLRDKNVHQLNMNYELPEDLNKDPAQGSSV
jgi:hypothetical protein